MLIHKNFIGGNITVEKTEGNSVFLEREKRDTTEWFYWAFCVEGAAGKTLDFIFPKENRVGRFGAAVSHDLKSWHWQDIEAAGDRFSYTFGENENKVYFAHHMLYDPERMNVFAAERAIPVKTLCTTEKGRKLPFLSFGEGKKHILLCSRHHCCESTGTYVLEGCISELFGKLPDDYSVTVIPFVDYDGMLDGDQGKNRIPHDHNRDYTDKPIYNSTKEIIRIVAENPPEIFMDFHSPGHMWNGNDYNFFSHAKTKMGASTDKFGKILADESSSLPLNYDGKNDVRSNEKWNSDNNPNSKNYMSDIPGIRLVLSTETAYFGFPESKVSIDRLLDFGRAYGRSILRFIAE